MKRSTLRTTGWLVTALLGVFLATAAAAEEGGQPMIVKIHADWCGTCTKLNTTFDELQTEVGEEAQLVILDVTDKDAVARSTAEADRLGIREFFDRYKGKTGTVGVIAADGEVVVVLKGEFDPAPYVTALEKAREA